MKAIIILFLLISLSSAQHFHESTTIIFGTGVRENTIEFQEYNKFYRINFMPESGTYYNYQTNFYYDYYSGGNILAPHYRTETTYLNSPWFWSNKPLYKPFGW